eukprot:gb/GEZN01011039.1/.p1 GENE.gb/GEZN01011039.1/~~gb/GEZN01011039.1/.p1  ORF type:complete len:112 (+),score=10.34 gb/GEZN01011039.1/:369-704(+)
MRACNHQLDVCPPAMSGRHAHKSLNLAFCYAEKKLDVKLTTNHRPNYSNISSLLKHQLAADQCVTLLPKVPSKLLKHINALEAILDAMNCEDKRAELEERIDSLKKCVTPA